MTRQQTLFTVIVGTAIIFAGAMMALNPLLTHLFEPPDLNATSTVMAIRATDVSLTATEVAIAATKAVLEGRLVAAEPVSQKTGEAAPDSKPPRQSGAEDLTWEGLQIDIVALNHKAWPLIKAHNQFNDPPLPGKQMFMITVRVTKVEGGSDEYIGLEASDFRLIGSRNEIYNTWDEKTSCGVVPDELNGVVALGLSMEGNICFQVPTDKNNYQLIYERRIGDYPAFYVDLPD